MRKLDAHFYNPVLMEWERGALRWWADALMNMARRLTRMREPKMGPVIYIDAATTTKIIAEIIIDPNTFRTEPIER